VTLALRVTNFARSGLIATESVAMTDKNITEEIEEIVNNMWIETELDHRFEVMSVTHHDDHISVNTTLAPMTLEQWREDREDGTIKQLN